MKTLTAIAAGLVLCVTAGATSLDQLKPKVSFAAWRVMSVAGEQMEGRYYYAPGKHRNEMNLGGQEMTTIVREDLGLVWNLMAEHAMYMELSVGEFSEQGGALGPETAQLLEHTRLGTETLDGHRTTKYRITVLDSTGDTATGYFWATGDLIPVRMELTSEQGERMVAELRDIEVGDQPAALFEVPAGFQRFALGEVAGGNLPWSSGNPYADEDSGFTGELLDVAGESAKEATRQGVQEGVQEKVTKKLRKLFGQ